MGVRDDLKIDQGYGICPVHGYAWRKGRNMGGAPEGLHCPFDGSMHPDEFMAYLEKPGTVLGPTDKNYKVYIDVAADPEQARRRRIVTHSPADRGPHEVGNYEWLRLAEAREKYPYLETTGWGEMADDEWVGLMPFGQTLNSKFYFEHLSEEQKLRFIELLNDGKLTIGEPGFFYRLPFFIASPSS